MVSIIKFCLMGTILFMTEQTPNQGKSTTGVREMTAR